MDDAVKNGLDTDAMTPQDASVGESSGSVGAGSAVRLLRAIRQRWPVILACVLVVPAVAIGISVQQTKEYRASAQVLFRDPGLDQKLFGATYTPPSTDPDRRAATNLQLASLDVVFDGAARRLGMTRTDVRDAVTVAPSGQSDVVSIAATDESPSRAALIANAVAFSLVNIRKAADRNAIQDAQQLVRRQLASAESTGDGKDTVDELRVRAQQLSVLAALQTGGVSVAQPAETPTSPASPRPRRNGAAGLILGLIIGVGLALTLNRFDRRVRTPADLEELFGRPVLGEIPESRAIGENTLGGALPAADSEGFRMLRANLIYFNVDEPIRSVLVMSSGPGEGKSTVSWRLAAAAAEAGDSVLLIEADLRRPTMASRNPELQGRAGLSDVLSGRMDFSDAVAPVNTGAPSTTGDVPPKMNVLIAGTTPPNPADLLESKRMTSLLDAAVKQYDLVVIDTPPVLVVSDVVPLVHSVSGVITVSRLDHTTKDDVRNLVAQLNRLGAPTLGVVANGVRDSSDRRYGYGYYGLGDQQAQS